MIGNNVFSRLRISKYLILFQFYVIVIGYEGQLLYILNILSVIQCYIAGEIK